jgi:homoserine O-acetyltransferase
MKLLQTILIRATLCVAPVTVSAATYPGPVEGDFVVRDFAFQSGETLPELKIHCRTIGSPRKDTNGVVRRPEA